MTITDVPQGLWLPPRVATLLVAASNALDRTRAQADYLCDGVADNVQIQAALNALPAANGRVMLSEGTFNCSVGITVPANSVLEGNHFNTVLNFNDGGAGTVINAITINGDGAAIKNLRVQLAAGTGAGGARPNVVYALNRNQVWLENLLVVGDTSVADDGSDLRQCGILFSGGGYSKIINCRVQSCDRHGIHLNACTNSAVEGNTSTGNTRWGILILNNSDWNNVFGNNCNLNGYGGIEVYTSDSVTVTGNICGSNTLHGILVWQSAYVAVIGNTCDRNSGHGIMLDSGSDGCTVTGNTCVLNDFGITGNYDGINISGDSTDNQVSSNYCSLNHRHGIYSGGSRNSIAGNGCSFNSQHGIVIGGDYSKVSGNYCYSNSTGGPGTCHGIYLLDEADLSNVVGNTCTNIIPPGVRLQEHGICLADGCVMVNIIGNYCSWGLGSGIILQGNNDDCNILSNYCYDNDDYGIEIVAATAERNVVKENRLPGNGIAAILDNGTGTALPLMFVPVPNPSTSIGAHPAELLTDGLEVMSRFNLYVPAEFQELVRAQIIIVPGGTGNLRRSVATNFGKVCSGEDYNTHTGSIAAGEVAVTVNDIECLSIVAALVGIAAMDLVGVEFTRHADHANDTVNANCYLLALRMQYV